MVTVHLSETQSLVEQSESLADDSLAADSMCPAEHRQLFSNIKDETRTEADGEHEDTQRQSAEGSEPSDQGSAEMAVTGIEPEASRAGDDVSVRSGSSGTQMSGHSGDVDWDGLEKSEEQEARDEACDEVCGSS